jgi:hypothetical protein
MIPQATGKIGHMRVQSMFKHQFPLGDMNFGLHPSSKRQGFQLRVSGNKTVSDLELAWFEHFSILDRNNAANLLASIAASCR